MLLMNQVRVNVGKFSYFYFHLSEISQMGFKNKKNKTKQKALIIRNKKN